MKSTVTLGRSEQNDVQVLDPKVSRFHCKIEKTIRGFMLIDLSSKNGTFVNGMKCSNALLEPGDVLKLGDNIFTMPSFMPPSPETLADQQQLKSLPQVPPPQERTREISPKTHLGSSLKGGNNQRNSRKKSNPLLSAPNNSGKGFLNNKIYLASGGLLLVGVIAILVHLFLHQNTTPPVTTDRGSLAQSKSTLPGDQIEQQDVSLEDRENATKIAREAGIALEAGDFNLALSMYNDALSLDSENILAKEGIGKTNAHIEKLARYCFQKGEKGLQAFNYATALKEFETVVLLLKDNQDHELFIKATQNIAQAQAKTSR